MLKFFFSQTEPRTIEPQFDSSLLKKHYQQLVSKQHIKSDDAQVQVLLHLQQLLNTISQQLELGKRSVFEQLKLSSENSTKSIYIFGDVGRGKSMLMDMFFDACPIGSKRRVHFHAFMQEIHEYMHLWRTKYNGDPLPSLAVKIRQQSRLLCFDEFQVTDIADAMLLARLFTRLFKLDVIFVATSNQHPDDLYQNGLQRELFLPFIALLKQSAEVVELAADEDYRLSHFKSMKTIFYSETEGGAEFLQQSFNELTNNGHAEQKTLKIKGRELDFAVVHGDILFTTFSELCGRALGAADYLEVANEFSTLLIADIPVLTVEIKDQVRRFVTLIDALYEHNVKLICTAAVPAEQLCFEDADFNFNRTRSRLIEMQSEKYIHGMHLS